jgi:Fe-S-cluster containining protein
MALQTDHNGMFIEGMTDATELMNFIKYKFGEEAIQDTYKVLLEQTKEEAREKGIPPLKAFWGLLDQTFQEKSNSLKCGKGCAHCCHTGVAATQFEWEGIVKGAKEKGIDLNAVIERSRRSIDRVKTALNSEKKFEQIDWHQSVMNHPCPFLDDEMNCIIYEDRPLDCRLVLAFRDACVSKKLEHAQRGIWIEESVAAPVIAKLQNEKTPKMKRKKFTGTQPLKLLQHWLIVWQEKNKKKRSKK